MAGVYKPKVLKGHLNAVTSVSVHPLDNNIICSASFDGTVRMWNVDNVDNGEIKMFGKYQGLLGPSILSVAFSPDGNTICSGSSYLDLTLWDVETKNSMSSEFEITAEDSNKKTFISHTSHVTSVSFSHDGEYICSGSKDKTVKLWTKTGNFIKTLTGHEGGVTSVSFSRDGKYICSASFDKTVRLWSVKPDEATRTLNGHTKFVNSVSFSPDGKYICSGSSDETVRLWSFDTGETIRTLKGHTSGVNCVSFSPDGKYICSGSNDKTVRLWNTETGNLINTLTGIECQPNSVSFTIDGKKICSGWSNQTVELWNVEEIIKKEEEKEKKTEILLQFGENKLNFKK
jgi:WD40 repeat protein